MRNLRRGRIVKFETEARIRKFMDLHRANPFPTVAPEKKAVSHHEGISGLGAGVAMMRHGSETLYRALCSNHPRIVDHLTRSRAV